MRVLLLPGVNPDTIDWMNRLTDLLPLDDGEMVPNQYRFWVENDGSKSIAREVANLPAGSFELVIAKSLGTLIFLQAFAENSTRFKRALLIGIPWQVIDQTDFAKIGLSCLTDPGIFVVQQVRDKLGPADGLKAYEPANLLVIEGKNHLYEGFHLYTREVSQWLKTPADINRRS